MEQAKGGMDNSKDRLGNVHENVFHFVKQAKGYYYNADSVRSKPRESKVVQWCNRIRYWRVWCSVQTSG